MDKSRRAFLGKSFTAIGAAALAPSLFSSCAGASSKPATPASDGKPNSVFNGVAIGTITYSFRSMPGGLENVVKYCREAGISTVELMSNDLEAYLGIPESPMRRIMQEAMKNMPAPAPGAPRQRPTFTPEQQAEIDKYNADVKEWRKNIDMDKVAAAKKYLDDNGIEAHVVKFSPGNWEDDQIDYAFKVAKAMGAKGVSDELNLEAAKKTAPFAEKYGIYTIYHNHMQYAENPTICDPVLAVSPNVMLNFDAGHFFGSTGRNPIEMIEKYHDRIVSMHIKDKTGPNTDPTPNQNQVWGQGQMPLAEVLNYIKEKKYPIYCDIELEYDVKPWSNAVKEVKTCVNYARQILL
ncbi:MAG: sugar phosphate isomerase/epimerase [Bacteroidaceae bacterium]|nr:sugar phosphate isomerase/epimerase [Bacteroidaceae bacterium]